MTLRPIHYLNKKNPYVRKLEKIHGPVFEKKFQKQSF